MNEISPAPKSGLVPGIVVGLVAAIVGAAIYAVIMDVTGYEFSLATIGIGVIVGLAIMAVKPTSPVLPLIAGVYSLAGAVAGTVAGDIALLVKTAEEQGGRIGYVDAYTIVIQHFSELIDFKTVLIWAAGTFFGFTFVNRRVDALKRSAAPAAEVPAGPLLPPMTASEGDAPQATQPATHQAAPAETAEAKTD